MTFLGEDIESGVEWNVDQVLSVTGITCFWICWHFSADWQLTCVLMSTVIAIHT